MEVSKNTVKENPNYLGYDEDHNGDWDDFFMCPNCKDNNYLIRMHNECEMCGEKIVWVGECTTT